MPPPDEPRMAVGEIEIASKWIAGQLRDAERAILGSSGAIKYMLERRGMQQVDGGIQLVEGSTRSHGMLRYPGRRDNNVAPVSGFYRFTVRASGASGKDGEIPRIRLVHKHPDESMQKIMEVDVTAGWDQPTEYTVIIPRDVLGNELSVELLSGTSLYMGQRPGEDFLRRNDELGEQGDFTETLRLEGRKIAESWGGDPSTPDPENLDLTTFPRVLLDYLEVEGPLHNQWPPKSHTMLLFNEQFDYQDNSPDNNPVYTDDLNYAREIFWRFATRAWRRPISDGELEPILTVVETELANGESFAAAPTNRSLRRVPSLVGSLWSGTGKL